MFLTDFIKNVKAKRFLLKSAKTAILFTGKYDKLMDDLNEDKKSLDKYFFEVEKSEPSGTNRLRQVRGKATKEKEKQHYDLTQTTYKELTKNLNNLNVYHISYQSKAIREFLNQAKGNKHVKYILEDKDMLNKLDSIDAKCEEVYKEAKLVAADNTQKVLVDKGFIDSKEDLKKYKALISKYI
jgi:hypothetical protein